MLNWKQKVWEEMALRERLAEAVSSVLLVFVVALQSCALSVEVGHEGGQSLSLSFTSNLFAETPLSGRATYYGVDVDGAMKIVGGVVYAQAESVAPGLGEHEEHGRLPEIDFALSELMFVAALDLRSDGLWPIFVYPYVPGSRASELADTDPFIPPRHHFPYVEFFTPVPFDGIRLRKLQDDSISGAEFWSSRFRDYFSSISAGKAPDLEGCRKPELWIRARGHGGRRLFFLARFSTTEDGSLVVSGGEVSVSGGMEPADVSELFDGYRVDWKGNSATFEVANHPEAGTSGFETPQSACIKILAFLALRLFSEAGG